MRNLKFVFCISVCILLVIFNKDAAFAARSGYDIFITNIFPALLPFFVFTSLLRSGSIRSQNKYIYFLLSIMSGAPGAARLLAHAKMPPNKKTQLCAALNTISPMFTIGVLSSVNLNCPVLALPILISQILSVLIMLIPFIKSDVSLLPDKDISTLSSAIKSAMDSMLSLCGTVVVFLVLLSVVRNLGFDRLLIYIGENILCLKDPKLLLTIASGILEITSGCISLGSLDLPLRLAAATGAFFVTFGGVCVLMQSKAFFNIKSSIYILFKLIQGIISAIFAYIITPFFMTESTAVFNTVSQERFAENTTSMVTLISVSMLVILFIFLLGISVKNIRSSRKR